MLCVCVSEDVLCVFEPYQIRQITTSPHTTGLKKRTRKPQKKTNGAPNGFYGEIDWDRYNSPEVDEEGYTPKEKSHFFSSSESEEEEDHRKKFKIKIRPLPADHNIAAPSVDELKASIGNIALSPSPLVSPANVSHAFQAYDVVSCLDTPGLYQYLTPMSVCLDSFVLVFWYLVLWSCKYLFFREKLYLVSLAFSFVFPSAFSLLMIFLFFYDICVVPDADGQKEEDNSRQTLQRPSITDLDNIFGPEDSPKPGQDVGDKWVCFNDEPPERPPPPSEGEPAPPLPSSPPPPAEPAPPLPKSSPPSEEPNPPLPKSPPPPRTIPPPLVLNQEDKKSHEENPTKEDPSESSASSKEIGQAPRSTPPPPPPPTYRAVVSSPGPIPPAGTSVNESGESSPSVCPCKKKVAQVLNRSFSPPVHSSSPPPLAPLARAESTSSISSTNSLSAATTPTVETDQPSLVWFDRGKFYLTFEGCSRGPSPLTMGAQDTLPVAAAFTETVNAYFKGADPNKCVVKITGEMVLSFPAGITRHFANNPSPAALTFSITNYSRLEHVLPNPQLLCCDTTQPNPNSKEFWVNMPNLMTHLKKVAEQKPQATYYNVDMLKYQVRPSKVKTVIQSTPLNLAVSWRCEPTSTDLRIDYKYNGGAMTTPVALNNVQFLIPVDGGVSKLQAVLPPAAWNAEQQRILWKIPDISQKAENGGVGSLLARFQLSEGPSKPAPVAVQFTSEGSTLSGCDIELVGLGYRFSLVKKRFAAGKYMADN
uniref:SH3-containing GRB2-like protein 3-interacting protein 1 n=1 Tax=Sinocyclocheilus anshuiensis TaxID=1608454 RepID=A0A671RWS5_9TELE